MYCCQPAATNATVDESAPELESVEQPELRAAKQDNFTS